MSHLNRSLAITAGSGFVGSNLVKHLNSLGYTNIDLYESDGWQRRWKNLVGLKYNGIFAFKDLAQLERYSCIIHLGANSATTASADADTWQSNYVNTVQTAVAAANKGVKFIYASSGSVYGAEESDFTERVTNLKPLNFYAYTKAAVDETLFSKLGIQKAPVFGLRFFNVYGPNEDYKGDMASVVHRWLKQPLTYRADVRSKGLLASLHEGLTGNPLHHYEDNVINPLKLFKSRRPGVEDGEQARDFVYVDDVCKVIAHCLEKEGLLANGDMGGVFNVGQGKATMYDDLAYITLITKGLDDVAEIFDYVQYVDMPDNVAKHYQYHTAADLTRLRDVLGYKGNMTSPAEGIKMTWEAMNR